MGSLSGILQRPFFAVTAVAVASFSSDFSDKLPSQRSPDAAASSSASPDLSNNSTFDFLKESKTLFASHISVSKLANLSFVTKIHAPVPNINFPIPTSSGNYVRNFHTSLVSSPVLSNLYQSAALTKASKQAASSHKIFSPPSEVMYRWHLPEPTSLDISGSSACSVAKSRTVVVLLGWLGAKQKHLKRYAEWYTSRGFHAITFTFPMSEILTYQIGGKVEQHVDLLVNHLADWLEEEHGKNLVFHTFSNTGWLTYGAILEKFQKHDSSVMGRIKGCIVDSAPVAAPDPQVWASGFSAAFLKKNSVATKGSTMLDNTRMEVSIRNKDDKESKPAVTEAALLMVLEKFFGVVLNLPTVNRRLSDVLDMLSSSQPSCPQLYIYSSADRVIPANSVESFIEEQRRAGREVRACNFVSTPHVDHYRNDPKLYSSQLSQFLADCVLTSCCRESC
ncbi:transmembrane protein 53 [Momordica charantia]|uniref:Transmembrane protein 53 n=1 Tax=Momordica charantia TaxID=3673 RepID=A0A6J1CIU0_MOMCH|nr:transmembrane protein 53 [Momordica charantia]XP_022141696.1 transmembrane protein 53 [Momordica charantia]